MSGLAVKAARRQLDLVPLSLTLIFFAIGVAVTVFAGWRGARPTDLMKGPRMIPWRFLMLLAGAISFLLAVHLAALFGLTQPATDRVL